LPKDTLALNFQLERLGTKYNLIGAIIEDNVTLKNEKN